MDFQVLTTMDFETHLLCQSLLDLGFLGLGSMDFENPMNQCLLDLDFQRHGPMDFERPMIPAPRSGDLKLTASNLVKLN